MNDIDKAYLLAIEEEKKFIKNNCEYFIDEYGWVYDKDVPEGKSRFNLWTEQKRVLEEVQDNRLNIILKARQLGITWLCLWYALWNLLHIFGYEVVALSKKEDDAKELINRLEFMLEQLPSWLIIEKKNAPKDYNGLMWESTALEVIIHHPSGENARFKSFTAAKDSGRSFTASLVLLDEWAFQQWAEEIWTAAYPTINRPTGGKVIGLSTAKRNTLFQNIWNNAEDYGFHSIFLAWWADPRRTPEWYEQTKKALSKNKKYMREYPATPEEAFSAGEGTSFPEFSKNIHVCEPFKVPEHWRKWASVDNGHSDPFAWYKYAISPDGIVFVYYEYSRWREEDQVIYSKQAKQFKEDLKYKAMVDGKIVEKDEKLDFIVAGTDAWATHHRDQSGKCLIDYYREGGLDRVGFLKAITDRKLRKATVHEYLEPYYDEVAQCYTAKVQIFNTCEYLIETLPQLINDEKDPEKVGDDSDIDNPYDSFGYGLIAYHAEKSKPEEQPKTRIQKRKEALIKKKKRNKRKLF